MSFNPPHIKVGLKNASFLVTGNVCSQIASFIGFIYIARALGPVSYGIYSMVGAFAGLFTLATFSGLNKVVLRKCAKNLERIPEIMEQTIGLRNLFSVMAWFLCLLVSLFVDYDASTKLYIALFSFEILTCAGIREAFFTVYQATEQMHYIAFLGTWRTVMFVSLAVISLSLGNGVLSLILLQVIIALVTLIINYRFAKNIYHFNMLSKIQVDWDMIRQGLIFSTIGFFNTLSNKIDLVMLSFLATPLEVGLYALPYKMVRRANAIKNLFGTSFFPIFVKKFDKGKVNTKRLLGMSMLILFLLSTAALIISVLGEKIILIFFGDQYQASAAILQVLIFYIVLNALSMLFGLSLQATHNEKISLYTVILQSILNICLNFILFKKYGVIGIAYSTLISTAIKTLLESSIGMYILKRKGFLA